MSAMYPGDLSKQSNWITFIYFAVRVIIVHMLTYFVFGLIMSNVFHYGEVFKLPVIRDYMLSMDQHNILLGPFMQPIRGLIFAIGLWPIRSLLLEKKHSWLILWGLLVTIGILSTPAAAPSSMEGILYTKLPMWYHLMGLPEILLQTLVFSIWLVWWESQVTERQPAVAKKENPLVTEIVKALMTACFAYIGYAAGGILLALMANARAAETGTGGVDFAAAGANFKMQFMFVIAFLINTIAVFWLARKWQANQMTLPLIFLIVWLLDAFTPWLYQTLVFGSSDILMVLMLGFLPAAIITFSLRLNYHKLAVYGSR